MTNDPSSKSNRDRNTWCCCCGDIEIGKCAPLEYGIHAGPPPMKNSDAVLLPHPESRSPTKSKSAIKPTSSRTRDSRGSSLGTLNPFGRFGTFSFPPRFFLLFESLPLTPLPYRGIKRASQTPALHMGHCCVSRNALSHLWEEPQIPEKV